MKNLRLAAFTVLTFTTAALPSRAAFYLTGTGLYNHVSDVNVSSASAFKGSLKDSTGYAAAVGYKFSLLRAEAELQYLKNDLGNGSSSLGTTSGSGDYKQFSGFLNGYVDFPSYYGLAAYAGAGVGLARVDLNNFSVFQGATNVVQFSGRDNAFAWQLMLGVQFHLFGQATIHAGYRLVNHESIALNNSAAASALEHVKFGDNNIFELGVSIGF